MRRWWLPLGITLILLLSGCAKKPEAIFLNFEGEAVALIRQGSVLHIVDMPGRVVGSYGSWHHLTTQETVQALVPVPGGSIHEVPEGNLRRIRLLLSAIGREMDMEDGWEALSFCRRQVDKSSLDDVMEGLLQVPGLWKEMKKAKYWEHLDLGQVLPQEIDWNEMEPWLDVWFQGALRTGQRRD